MQAHQQLIEKFYSSFQQLDWKGMTDCYHEAVFFYDPVFENLDAKRATAMWEMLCKNAKNFKLEFSQVQADEEYGTCSWQATYTFSKTGRVVTNYIKAHFKFHEGKIVEHMDHFNVWKWSRQALGASGFLLGWSPLVQNKIRAEARRNLEKFMSSRELGNRSV